MEAINFALSFVTFVTPNRANNARIQVECACELTSPVGRAEQFLLVASCKAEDTYADDNLFRLPNYDFCGIFSLSDYTIIRTHAVAEAESKETGTIAERFEGVRIEVRRAPAQILTTNAEIVRATLANEPLVARTELAENGWRAVIEYPVKTMNANDIEHMFQVDTGPVLFPDLTAEVSRPIERFELAYVAFNRSDRTEFILQVPTPIECGGEQAQVPHYSRVVKVVARNQVIALVN
ncbi:MAG: hypothetical protein ACUVX8_04790 [Candidatus Zipacnadales bacterium]